MNYQLTFEVETDKQSKLDADFSSCHDQFVCAWEIFPEQ